MSISVIGSQSHARTGAHPSPCPVAKGCSVTYGWKQLLWHRVDEVGDAVFTGSGWLIPVYYANGKYALLYYRFGDGSALRFDELQEIHSGTWTCQWQLQHSVAMPVIKYAGVDMIVMHVLREVPTTEEEYGWYGEEYRTEYYELWLYGILGPRNGRADTLKPTRSPQFM